MRTLRPLARGAGIYVPQLPVELGGLGLSWRERAVVLEEAGRSYLGPGAMNCAAPDQPNMISLLRHGTPAQKQQIPGAAGRGRHPLLLRHDRARARRRLRPVDAAGRTRGARGGGWVINGHKWFITGAVGAAFAIVLAQTDEGADAVHRRHRQPRLPAGAQHPRDRSAMPIGGHGEIRLARLPGERRRRAGRGGPGLRLCAAAAGAGAAVALHALHRPRSPRAGARAGLREQRAARSASDWPTCSRCRPWWPTATSTCMPAA